MRKFYVFYLTLVLIKILDSHIFCHAIESISELVYKTNMDNYQENRSNFLKIWQSNQLKIGNIDVSV